MNNKPVAWIANDADLPLKEDGSYWLYPENPNEDNLYIPLYTHPVKEQLTDDEILDTFDPHFDADIEDKELIKFARAILKKAREG